MKLFEAKILTPDGTIFEGQVESIRVPGSMGDLQVLINHANLLAALDVGPVTLLDPTGKTQKFAISGGVVDVNNNVVSLFAEAAELSENINIERARASKERAELRIKDLTVDQVRAEASLKRAMNRIKVASR
jgi:F-type H+-transporting ATPase subunit epsilon